VAIRVWNTRTASLEEFEPARPPKVGMYVCGLTPQDFTHVGHARAYVVFDAVRRYLEYKGFRVLYVQNYTDIDDKIIARARQAGVQPHELAQRFMEECDYDFARLNIRRPDITPLVTEHIEDIVAVVAKLVDDGFAYPAPDGSVYFRIAKARTFGTLTHQKLEQMRVGARVDPDERKEDPMDFALWKAAKEGEPAWDSPWGKGRPGWHIECSVMGMKYLGPQMDIHGGGIDLIFPHHEAEVMQSEAFTGKVPFARFWMHNGHVTLANEKMSKSVGNFKTVREILEEYRPQELRFHLLNTHYRKPLEWNPDSLRGDAAGFRRIEQAVLDVRARVRRARGEQDGKQTRVMKSASKLTQQVMRAFQEAMENDFNTREAIAAVFDFVRETNAFLEREDDLAIPTLHELHNTYSELLGVLGISVGEEPGSSELVTGLIEYLLELREAARARRDFQAADAIRDRLASMGVEVMDSAKGPSWKVRG
jgi:cysteinyl-tRNA synthetase